MHAAAKTGILESEKERGDKKGLFWRTNVRGTKNVVDACLKNKIFMIFFSAETVFAGRRERPGPYSEEDAPEENWQFLSWYGWTKREGERLVSTLVPNWAIVRLSSVVGKGSLSRPDYLQKIVRKFDEGELGPMFVDQKIALSDLDEALEVIKMIVKKRLEGIFHAASFDQFSPYELANYLLKKTRSTRSGLVASSLEDFLKTYPHTFPQFSGLKTDKTQKLLGVKFSSWKQIIDRKYPQG